MNDIVKVVGIRHLGRYRLHIRFSDGCDGERDFECLVRGGGVMVEPLADERMFSRAFIQMGTLAWPNGFDLDSIALRDEMEAAGQLARHAA